MIRRRPLAVAVGGLSGAGKSTLAAALAQRLGATVVATDTLRKERLGLPPWERAPASAYAPEAIAEVFAATLARAGDLLSAGTDVVVDAVFARAGERTEIAKIAADSEAAFCGLWLAVPLADRRTRLAGRAPGPSDATDAVALRQETYDLGRIDWYRLDASDAPEAVLTDALDRIAIGRRG